MLECLNTSPSASRREKCARKLLRNVRKVWSMCQISLRRQRCVNLLLKICCLIQYVPDLFVTDEMLEKCQNEEWIVLYKQRKDHKAKIKEELLSVAWHQSRVIDWCISEKNSLLMT